MILNGSTNLGPPDKMLINGKGPYLDPSTKSYESFTFTSGINNFYSSIMNLKI